MSETKPHNLAIKRVIEIIGGQSALARLLGTSQSSVWKWVHSSKGLPAEFVLPVEAATGVPRHHLRPDIYPADLGPSPSWHGVDGGGARVVFARQGKMHGSAAT